MGNGYSIVTTKAFVLKTKPIGEADRLVVLFSQKLGKITIYAKSVRLGKSKLKPFAYPYRYGIFDIIVGKKYILKDARCLDCFDEIWRNQNRYGIFVSLLRNVDMFIEGVEVNTNIFDSIEKTTTYLQQQPVSQLAAQHTPIVTVFQFLVLQELGCVDWGNSIGMSFLQLVTEVATRTATGRYLEEQVNAYLLTQHVGGR